MRHLVDQHEMRVDPGAAILQAGGGLHAAADILGPDGGGQAVIAVVCPGNGIIGIGEAGDRDDRAEDLAADDFVVLQGACDDGRREEEALVAGDLAAVK